MSMLTRKGTMVRKNRSSLKRQSRRSQTSQGSLRKSSGSFKGNSQPSITAVKNEAYVQGSPARSVTSTVVSFDDERHLYKTTIDWSSSGPGANGTQPTIYDSTFIQLQEANREVDNTCEFLCRSSKICCHTVFVTVLVGVSMILPIAMISIGVKYLNECPKQRNIPVYLLVGGCFGALKLLGTVWRNIQHRRYDDLDSFYDAHEGDDAYATSTYKLMDILLSMFLLSWLITGTYWVFSIWRPHFTQILHEPSNWCDRTVYMFAAYQIVGCYIFLCFLIVIALFLAACHKCTKSCERV